jgi:NitT/TauT family transport system permease protein
MSKGWKLRLFRFIPLVVFIVTWELFVRGNRERLFFFGSPIRVAGYLWAKTLDLSLPIDFLVTLGEALAGFIIGNLIGTAAGLILWYSRTAFVIAKPYIVALGSAPIFALAPILIIWFGTGVLSKIMIASLSTVFIALLQAYTGASEVSSDYVRLMKTFGSSKGQIFRKVIAPASIVWVMSAFRLNVGFALLGAFIGEFISSNQGLGHLILVESGRFNISLVLCGVLLLVCMALMLTFAIGIIEPALERLVVRYL